MAFSSFGTARSGLDAPSAAGATRLRQAAAALLPLALLLVWTAAVRLPFYGIASGDEFFFSAVASEWLRGGLPYVDAFDIKPPGIFFVYAIVQSLFGASYVTFKGMEIVAVALGAWSLYAMLRTIGPSRLAVWCAALFPVYTLAFDGTAAVNMLLQVPLIIAGFAAVVAATRNDAALRDRLRAAFLAGLAIGAAAMVKQTAVFEATAAFVLILAYGVYGARLKMLLLFVVGATLPALAFSAYFLAAGAFPEMFNAVVVLALRRLDPEVVAAYGPDFAFYLTPAGSLVNAILRSLVAIFLWSGAIFTLLRTKLIVSLVSPRLLVIAATWLAFALMSAAYGRMLCDYYLLGIVPPLLILAGAFFCCGLRSAPRQRDFVLWASIVAASATLLWTQHRELFGRDPLAIDRVLIARAVDAFQKLGMKSDDRLLALNGGLELFMATGMRPPTPYFHTAHLMSVFQTPSPDPLGDALMAHPRFIVLSDLGTWHITQLLDRLKRAQNYLAAHYRVAATVHGALGSYTIYEFVS